MVTTNVVATVGCSIVWASSSIVQLYSSYRSNRQRAIQLPSDDDDDDDEDDYGLSQASIQGQLGPEEIEAINHIQKRLDGSPIKVEQHKKYVRNSRLLISACTALALALLGTQIGLQKPIKQSSNPIGWSGAFHNPACWPLFADVFVWLNIFYFALQGMRGSTYWSAIVQISVLSMTSLGSCVYMLVIPEAISNDQVPYYGAQFILAFVTLALSINVPSGPRHEKETPSGPRKMAKLSHKGRSVFSQLWFTGSFDVIRIAQRKGTIDEDDPPLLGSDFDAHLVHIEFKRQYTKSVQKANKHESQHSNKRKMFSLIRDSWPIARALFFANARLFIMHHLMLTVAAFGWYIPSFVSFAVVRFLENSEKGDDGPLSGSDRLRFGFQYCLLLVFAILAQSLLVGQALSILLTWLRNRIRTQLQMAIFAKALRRKDVGGIEDFKVNDAAKGDTEEDKSKEAEEEEDDEAGSGSFSKAQVINLVSVDAERVSQVFFLFTLAMAPIEILTGGFFAIYLLGWSAVIGLATSFAIQPLLYFLGKAMTKAEDKHQEVRDRKTSLLNEVIQAIRMIKFNAWESKASVRIQKYRDEELYYQKWIYLYETLQGVVMAFSPIAVNLVAFGWYTLVQKNALTPSVGFTAFQVLDELRFSLTYIPEAISQMIQTLVSLRRIQRYLNSEEVEIPRRKKVAASPHVDITLSNASIGWPKIIQTSTREEEQGIKPAFNLDNISIRFTPNALNLIVGRLGSGKTLLLKGLLGEADLLQGDINCPRSLPNSIDKNLNLSAETWMRADQVAYLPQSSFLVNATLRENILFGLPLLEQRYESTLDACGLRPDLKLLNDADETEIGENGIGLSGGQASRVMLARAIYGRACTLILDDPLSAVDAHTAAHIHTNLLRGSLCQNRTVILVTHQVQLVAQSAAKIVMLNEGKLQFDGDSTTFMNSDLYSGLIEEEEHEQQKETGKDGIATDSAPESSAETSLNTTPATTAPPSPTLNDKKDLEVNESPKKPKKLVEEEKRAKGAVLRSIYARYVKACGGLPVVIIVSLTLIAFDLMVIVVTKWLQFWTEDVERGLKDEHIRQHSDLWWLTWFTVIWAFQIVLEGAKMLTLVFASLQASKVLFKEMLKAVLKAPLRFHDTVSRGRLLNRFSYDFKEMDSEVVDTFERTADQAISIVLTMTAIATGGGLPFIGFFILTVPLYVYVGNLYLLAVRDLKRLASTSRSPILNTIGDVIRGTVVIRAFGAVDHFYNTLVERMNAQTTYNYFINEVRFWYEEMFNTFSFFVLLVAVVFILLNTSIKASQAGFIFTFLINAHVHLLFLLRAITDMEQKLVSVERIVEYSQLEGERDMEGGADNNAIISSQWPEQGEIEVDNLHVRYASDLPDVLHGITFKVAPHSKVGIVGPTGCGKSTLASAFFRFVEKTKGSIKIDGFDIGQIKLEQLRSRLQIVPQDPIIFSGPLRASLDVFDEYTDEQVIEALKKVQLIDDESEAQLVDVENGTKTQKRDFSDLNFMVAEGGSNLSNGEKQLLCLARAILRNCKLIIFDEATSSVDFDTDAIISQTIRQAFERSTIITIAHRLRTIIDYDLVAVMEKGNIVEFEKPSKLLGDPSSRFYKLCRASGKRELVFLKQSAGIE